MNRPRILGSIGLLCAWLAGVAHADPPSSSAPEPRVGVVVTLSVNATEEENRRLTAALGQALEAKFMIDAVTENELPHVEVPVDCLAQRACVKDVARALGVGELLLLTVVRVGERFQVAITWGNGADGTTISRVNIDIDVEQQDPGPVFGVYARRLLPHAALRPEPRAPDAPDTNGSKPAGGGSDASGSSGSSAPDPNLAGPGIDDPGTRRRMTGGAWIAAGAGAALLAGGIGFGLSARSAYNQLDGDRCRTVMCADEDIARVESRARLADICFGAAVAAGATAAVLYWRSGKRAPGRSVDVGAYATGRDAYVTIGGRF